MRRIVFEQDEDEAGAETSAAEWRAMRAALGERLQALIAERDRASDESARMKLQTRVDEARQQIRALAIEEGAAKFTEDSEQYVQATGMIREELSRDPDEEIA